MVNQLRGLKIKGYHPKESAIPQDVVEIDILYKETNNPTVYTVKTVKPNDGHPLWPDTSEAYVWNPTTLTFEYDSQNFDARGELELTTDMIHSVVPSNQLLRPYDNVPKKALAQEISANRIIYGNYVQNFDIPSFPTFSFDILQEEYKSDYALPSVKSMRDYQIGVVFGDEYGRETPVLSPLKKGPAVRLQKNGSDTRNRLRVSLDTDTQVPSWAKYYSFYVKETSVQYYTMAMDRWYEATDGNVWISFPSSERNKITEEDYIVLKKGHGTNSVVKEKARYKVLAIESQAPEDITVRKKSLGTTAITPSTSTSWPVPGASFIYVNGALVNSTYGVGFAEDLPDLSLIHI